MLLAVDIGNTQTTMGVYDGDEMRASWRVSSDRSWASDQILIQLRSLVSLDGGVEGKIDDAIVCSGVPVLTDAWQGALEHMLGKPAHTVSAANDYGLPVVYPNPQEIGPDRIADAVAALEKYGPSTIVVDLGTATNIGVVNDRGEFIGGLIAPGMQISADALFQRAAKLAQVELKAPDRVIGKSTVEAMQSGIVYGEVARVDGLVSMIERELGYEATVVATGGLHPLVAPLSSKIQHSDGNLTLDGLRIISERI